MSLTNARRSAGLGPSRGRGDAEMKGRAKILVLLVIGALLLGVGIAKFAPQSVSYGVRHTVYVDGSDDDWIGTLPSNSNESQLSSEELVWKDAVGDQRNDFESSGDTRVDITEFRATADDNYLYLMLKFDDMSGFSIGDNGATFVAIAIDTDQVNGSGQTYFAGDSDTTVNDTAAWEYQVVVNLADSRYGGQSLSRLVHPLNESTNNWGAVFQLINSSWGHVYISGDDGSYGALGVNLTQGVVEIKLSWSALGGIPVTGNLNFTVMSARGWSDYTNDKGGTWDISGASDALDCVTTTGPNTWNEVSDGAVNYHIEVSVTDLGGPAIPEFGVFALPLLAVFFVLLLRRR